MVSTIIVPLAGPRLDPEGISEQALPIARALAERLSATVHLISIIDFLSELGGLPESELEKPETIQKYSREREEYLKQIAETIPNARTITHVRFGDPGQGLLSELETTSSPIMVMASHNRKGIHRLVLGSVAFTCVQRADCPVIVVPANDTHDTTSVTRLEKLLVPLDGSALAESVLDSVLHFIGSPAPSLHLIQVIEPVSRRFVSGDHEYDSVTYNRAVRYLEDLARRLILDDYDVTWEVRAGKLDVEISQVCAERDIDLIAMATQGQAGFSHLLFGSVEERVARSSIVPLFLIQPSETMVNAYIRDVRSGRRSASGKAYPELAERRVGELMTTPPITAPLDASLESIARLKVDHRIGSVLIVDDEGQLRGIITESDFTGHEQGIPFTAYSVPKLFGEWISTEGYERILAAGRELKARQIMSAPVVTATEDEPVTRIVQRFIENDIKRIPVVRNGVPVGVIARHDLLKLLATSEDNHEESRSAAEK